jgi:hypothetical protein
MGENVLAASDVARFYSSHRRYLLRTSRIVVGNLKRKFRKRNPSMGGSKSPRGVTYIAVFKIHHTG